MVTMIDNAEYPEPGFDFQRGRIINYPVKFRVPELCVSGIGISLFVHAASKKLRPGTVELLLWLVKILTG
jgi:hypothetical protein